MTKNNRVVVGFILLLIVAVAMGCGGAGPSGKDGPVTKDVVRQKDGSLVLSAKAKKKFTSVVDDYLAAKKAGWTESSCEQVAERFEDMADDYKELAEARYNAGAVYVECGQMEKAKEAFEKTIKDHPKHQYTLAQLAVFDLEAGNQSAAEAKLKTAILAGRNDVKAVPAYTINASILRKKAKAGDGDAWAKAQKNLRTALAIDSKYMPALHSLTMLYFDIATQLNKPSYLTLATLVYNQAKELDPEYAPIYFALGKILLEKKELVEALKAFRAAFEKDPKMFEAYMSYAAINLNFRGYQAAKGAFEKAIALRPNSYEAHMGLGVAQRGLEDYAAAKAEYKKAAEIDPKRTDYIFNLGLLEMDYLNTGTPEGYEKAKKVFETFLQKHTKAHAIDPDGKRGPKKSWVQKAKDRIVKCEKNAEMIRQAEKEMAELEKMAAEQAKQEAAMQEQMKQAEKLAAQEAEGKVAEGANVDEAALDQELEAEEAKATEAAAEEAAAKKAKEEADAAEGKVDETAPPEAKK